jgi:uncharacterized membrane protein YgcG
MFRLKLARQGCTVSCPYGVFTVLDEVAKTLIDNKITPNFKEGMYFEGIISALNEVSELMKNKFPPSN